MRTRARTKEKEVLAYGFLVLIRIEYKGGMSSEELKNKDGLS